MNKVYTIFVSLIDNNIHIDIFSIRNIVEKENQVREILLSNLIKPADDIIEKIVQKIDSCEN